VDGKPGSGKKCKKWIVQNVDFVEELVLGQENALGTHNFDKTLCQIQETGIPKMSVHWIEAAVL